MSTTKEAIGFIGVGLMGQGMAANLLAKGFPLTVIGHRNRKPVEELELSATVIYGGARYADAANNVKLPDYVTADFTALYALDARSQFKFSVANVFNEQYQTKQSYRAPGRTIDFSFTRSF